MTTEEKLRDLLQTDVRELGPDVWEVDQMAVMLQAKITPSNAMLTRIDELWEKYRG